MCEAIHSTDLRCVGWYIAADVLDGAVYLHLQEMASKSTAEDINLRHFVFLNFDRLSWVFPAFSYRCQQPRDAAVYAPGLSLHSIVTFQGCARKQLRALRNVQSEVRVFMLVRRYVKAAVT